jgi:hypothetical protein
VLGVRWVCECDCQWRRKSHFQNWRRLEAGGSPIPPPLLFNFVGDVLYKMLDKATRKGLISGLLGDFRAGGIVSLQYVDDTLLFSSADVRCLRNLKGGVNVV